MRDKGWEMLVGAGPHPLSSIQYPASYIFHPFCLLWEDKNEARIGIAYGFAGGENHRGG